MIEPKNTNIFKCVQVLNRCKMKAIIFGLNHIPMC